MAAYIYLKNFPGEKNQVKTLLLPSLFLGGGVFFLFLAIWPIISFEFFSRIKLNNEIVSPISEEQVLGTQTDLMQISNWFPMIQRQNFSSKITSYTLSIPKLKIKEATVLIGGEDLSKSLIQWEGTALPGDFGNTVIFGHSVLPVFFNPKNYTTIFSTLPELKEGDRIEVYFDGITYTYEVFEMKVVDPKDISVLEQKYDNSYISLITCVPPGTYWKRLVVKARLVKI